jgi:seryl-tRNA synthetase
MWHFKNPKDDKEKQREEKLRKLHKAEKYLAKLEDQLIELYEWRGQCRVRMTQLQEEETRYSFQLERSKELAKDLRARIKQEIESLAVVNK